MSLLIRIFSFAFIFAAAVVNADKRPANIILIMADDLGYETINCNGGTSWETPNIDKLAENGVRFDHCYSQPLCTPSRVKIMTGIYNVRNYVNFGVLDRKVTTFGHLFKKAGYATAICGKWQLGKEKDAPQHFGFDESCLWQHWRSGRKKGRIDGRYENPILEINGRERDFNNGEFGSDVVNKFACDFISKNKEKPFFLYYPMILTHCPFVATPDSADYDPKSPGSKSYKGKVKYFGDMLAYADKMVGNIVKKLKEEGLSENTLIIFTGDNGTDKPVVSMMGSRQVPGGKGSMDDSGNHVPLVVSWPGTINKGGETNTLVDFSDMLPTICAAAGISVPAELNIDGRSFLPQLKGDFSNEREWIYVWYSRNGLNKDTKVFVRNQRYKLYDDGKFFDVEKDIWEKTPLMENSLSTEQQKLKDEFQQVLLSKKRVK